MGSKGNTNLLELRLRLKILRMKFKSTDKLETNCIMKKALTNLLANDTRF